MGNTLQVTRDLAEAVLSPKRMRPTDWAVKTPSPKRVRLASFEENGAKAVPVPNHGVIIHIK